MEEKQADKSEESMPLQEELKKQAEQGNKSEESIPLLEELKKQAQQGDKKGIDQSTNPSIGQFQQNPMAMPAQPKNDTVTKVFGGFTFGYLGFLMGGPIGLLLGAYLGSVAGTLVPKTGRFVAKMIKKTYQKRKVKKQRQKKVKEKRVHKKLQKDNPLTVGHNKKGHAVAQEHNIQPHTPLINIDLDAFTKVAPGLVRRHTTGGIKEKSKIKRKIGNPNRYQRT